MRKKEFIGVILLALALGASPAIVEAQDEERRWLGWLVQWENDAFAVASGSDEHYTNGVRVSMVQNPEFNGDRVEALGDWWCQRFCTQEPHDDFFGFSFGHNFYTPDSLSSPTLIVDDRPFAALLYGSLFVNILNESSTVQQTLEAQFGFIGPEAGGESIQREIHVILDDELPQGWDNQLGFEPVINLNYHFAKRMVLIGSGNVAKLDFVPHWGLGAGTIVTRASGGGTLRFGKDISGFPQYEVANTFGGVSPDGFGGGGIAADRDNLELYAFIGVEGRAVLHNIFLDGNTFSDSHRVDKRDQVVDLRAGFFARWKGWQLNYTFVRRSPEFDPLRGRRSGRHDFGSVTFGRVLSLKKNG